MLTQNSRGWLFEEKGAALSEYATILGVLVLAALATLTLFGSNVSRTTTSVYSNLSHTTDVAPAVFGPGDVRTGTRFDLP